MKKSLIIPGLLVSGTLMLTMSPAQAASPDILTTIIDDFSFANPNPTTLTLTGLSSATVTNTATAPLSDISILGGRRLTTFTRSCVPIPPNPAIQNCIGTGSNRQGTLTIDPDSHGTISGDMGIINIENRSVFKSSTSLLYNGPGGLGLGAAGNLSKRDYFSLYLETVNSSTGTVSVGIKVTDNDSNFTVTKTGLSSLNAGPLDFMFKNFTGIDFSQVSSVELLIDGTKNDYDTEISSFSAKTTPESSAVVGLASLGLLGLLTRKNLGASPSEKDKD